MILTRSRASASVLHEQAVRMQREYPELFAYLQKRDAMLQRALSRLPNGYDVELCAMPYPGSSIEAALRHLEPGISEIANS